MAEIGPYTYTYIHTKPYTYMYIRSHYPHCFTEYHQFFITHYWYKFSWYMFTYYKSSAFRM